MKMRRIRDKRSHLNLLMVLVMCTFLFFPVQQSFAKSTIHRYENPKKLYKSARTAYHALANSRSIKVLPKKWERVIGKFKIIIDNFPKSFEAYKAAFTMGGIYSTMYKNFGRSTDLDRALYYYRLAALRQGRDSLGDDILYAIGEIFLKRNNFEEARKAYGTLLERYPHGDHVKRARKRVENLKNYSRSSKIVKKNNSTRSSRPVTLKNIRMISLSENPKTLIEIDGPVVFKSNQLLNPHRYYIDIENSLLSQGLPSAIVVNSKKIKKIRINQFNKTVSRVVFELLENSKFDIKSRTTLEGIEVEVISPSVNSNKKRATYKNLKNKRLKSQFEGVPLIVLDPGHGGKDDGAHGRSGLLEKHLNLAISKRVKRILESRYGFRVAMTRGDDRFIALNKRGNIANHLNAEIFVSIHVNAATRKGARGIETYFLGRGLSERARETAARENGEVIFSVPNNDVQRILMDMEANRKMNNSSCLARKVQDRLAKGMKKYYSRVKNLGVKEGPFYVLHTTYMPSILVEVGFISNLQEEKRLRNSRYLDRLADNIARGIKVATPIDKKCAQTI
tara:strand:+ start:1216 stop:2907 length:1692 start_codon:yes stop_codon:yes gene_type:complete